MNLDISTILFFLGIVFFFTYFVLFAKTMKTLSSEDLKKHNQISKPLNNLLSTAPIFIVFFIKGFWLTLTLAITGFAFATWQTFQFNTKLKNAGFNNEFIKRLNYVTLLAGLSLLLIFSGVCYEQFHA